MRPHLTVSRSDVERIVRRDFPADQFDDVMTTLDDRVQLSHALADIRTDQGAFG